MASVGAALDAGGGDSLAGAGFAQAEAWSNAGKRAARRQRPKVGDMAPRIAGNRRVGAAVGLVITVPPMTRLARLSILLVPCLLAAGLALLGCRESPRTKTTPQAADRPTLRVFVLGGAAGAVEPCGCVADMLGGVDHAAALLSQKRGAAQGTLVLGAGPMFFQDPVLAPEGISQARFKAEAMALSLHDLGLAAWAPGQNDWALGIAEFQALSRATGARPLAANLGGEAGTVATSEVVTAGGLSIGLLGLSLPRAEGALEKVPRGDPRVALEREIQAATSRGAKILIGLLAAPRGEALRLVEQVPGLHLVVLGKEKDQGENNDAPFEPMLVGRTLVVQGQNHLQGVGVVDLFVRGDAYSFEDGTGLERAAERASVERRLLSAERRLEQARASGGGVPSADVRKLEADVKGLKAEAKKLDQPEAPRSGSYFLVDLVAVRETAGVDRGVADRLLAYYQRVNEHNRETFKDKKPQPAQPGESRYVGVDQCTTCHQEERAFWDKTAHARAYATLEAGHKQFNLDCVSCHVTGYEKPGGSTVTHVQGLTSVQCENCHGPGSRHVENPANDAFIDAKPTTALCPTCHHSPHVHDDWSAEQAFTKIVGPGHGR